MKSQKGQPTRWEFLQTNRLSCLKYFHADVLELVMSAVLFNFFFNPDAVGIVNPADLCMYNKHRKV